MSLCISFFKYIFRNSCPRGYTPKTRLKESDKLLSTSDVFVRREDKSYEWWILNPNWKYLPSIKISDEIGLVILTCCGHSNGTKHMIILTPILPFYILSIIYSEQFEADILKCDTTKPLETA